jgi:large subunit ribosomal protein L1
MQEMATQDFDLKSILHKVREVSKKRKCKEAFELILKL